jgi:hypothetical protein
METNSRSVRSIGLDGARTSILAVTSLAAGAIHAVVVPEHLRESLLFGVFFAVIATFQIGWAGMTRDGFDPGRRFLATGVLVNAGIVVLWIVSRTVGVPVGPEPWMPEPRSVLDVTATVLELVFVATALLVPERSSRDGARTS